MTGRSESANAMASTAPTATAAMRPTLSGEMRLPAIMKASTAMPGTIAITPPKSLPHAGQPSSATVTSPAATTRATAAARRPSRSGHSASQAALRIEPVAKTANAMLPKP